LLIANEPGSRVCLASLRAAPRAGDAIDFLLHLSNSQSFAARLVVPDLEAHQAAPSFRSPRTCEGVERRKGARVRVRRTRACLARARGACLARAREDACEASCARYVGRCAPRRSTAALSRLRVAHEFPRLRPRTALARSSSRSELLVCGSYCPRGRSPKTPRGRGYEPRTAGTAAPRSVFGTSPEAPSREPGWRYEYAPRTCLSIGKVRRGRFQNMQRTRRFCKTDESCRPDLGCNTWKERPLPG